MIASFCKSFVAFSTSIPLATASLFALREAANRAGFDAQYPSSHQCGQRFVTVASRSVDPRPRRQSGMRGAWPFS